jgi:hypothetical protein
LDSSPSLKIFRGLGPESQRSILNVASKIGTKVGLKSKQTEAWILDSKTPMKNIRIEDLNELTARNIKRTNFKISKVVEEISKDMTNAMF